MPNGTRRTAGINTTENQQKYRGRGLDNRFKGQNPKEFAKEWVRNLLAEGPITEADVHLHASQSHVDRLLLMHVKVELGIETVRNEGGIWVWRMPQTPPTDEEAVAAVKKTFTIERTKPGEDEFSLTPAELKSFGIKDTEDYCWVRDPRMWEETRIAPGRIREVKEDNPGARVITFKGEHVTCGPDLILVARPRVNVEQAQARNLQRESERQRRVDRGQMDDDFDPSDRDAMVERRDRNTADNISTGRIGPNSPSSGKGYEEYVRLAGLTPQQIEEEKITYCFGHAVDLTALAAEDKQMQQERDRRRDSGGKFTSIPQNVRPRNLMQRTNMEGAAK